MTVCGAVRLIIALVTIGHGSASLAQADAQALFLEGYELLTGGRMKEAVPKFEAGLKVEPDNALARFYLGETLFALGRRNEARAQLARSLELDPNSKVASVARKLLDELDSNPFAGGKADAEVDTAIYPLSGRVLQDCPVCPELVVVPGGRFIMGSLPTDFDHESDEYPAHRVTIDRPFALGKYEVTFDQWEACIREKGCGPVDDAGWGRGKRPVIKVSYEQALGYAEWLSEKTGSKYRLPSEAEWEYAARARSDTPRFWGLSAERACTYANVANPSTAAEPWWNKDWIAHTCEDGYKSATAPVGSYKPNAFGLYDMLGNVWEWVDDCYHVSYNGAPTDGRVWGTGECAEHVVRGGGWYDGPSVARSAKRFRTRPTFRSNVLGFRVAREVP